MVRFLGHTGLEPQRSMAILMYSKAETGLMLRVKDGYRIFSMLIGSETQKRYKVRSWNR